MNKGYLVCDSGNELGFAVIAESEVEAKTAVREAGWLEDCNNIECHIIPGANIEGLPLGMVEDERDALCRGLCDFLEDSRCDECKYHSELTCHEGRALCEDCIWDAINGDDEE